MFEMSELYLTISEPNRLYKHLLEDFEVRMSHGNQRSYTALETNIYVVRFSIAARDPLGSLKTTYISRQIWLSRHFIEIDFEHLCLSRLKRARE